MEGLGIDLKFILAQIANFLILLFILQKVLYKPILKILADRKKKIDEGLIDADKIRQELEAINKEKEQILKSARGEGLKIIEKQRDVAENQKEEIIMNANKEAKRVLESAGQRLKEEEELMIAQVRERIGLLATQMAEKIISEKLTPEGQRRIVEERIKELKA